MVKKLNRFYFSGLVGIFVFGIIVLPTSTNMSPSEISQLIARAIFVMVILYILSFAICYLIRGRKKRQDDPEHKKVDRIKGASEKVQRGLGIR